MDFTLDETQEDLRRLARSIFDERVTLPRLREVEESDEGIDRDLWAELAKADLLGVALPEEVGGSGHGIMELCVLMEEVGRRVAPIPLMSTIGLGALPIARFGTTEQKKKHLVPVVEGASFLTAALEEPSNSDALRAVGNRNARRIALAFGRNKGCCSSRAAGRPSCCQCAHGRERNRTLPTRSTRTRC